MKKYAAEILPKLSGGIGLRYLSEFTIFSIYYEIMALQATSYSKIHNYTAGLINSLNALLGEDFQWKKPPKSPLSGGLAMFLFKKQLMQFKWSLAH